MRLLIVACFSVLLISPTIAMAAKPNILLVCVDDLKPMLQCYGEPLAKTPHIDRFAAMSMQFERAYCNQAVCSPSRNALLVGLRPQSLGIYDLPTNFRKAQPNAVTLPEHFKSHGYHTQSLGKIFHVGHGNTDDSQSWSVPSFRPRAAAYALAESQIRAADGNGAPTESADVPDETYADGATAMEAVRRLEDAAKQPERPFFLAVGFIRPHLPFVAPKKYWDMHDPKKIALSEVKVAPKDAPSYAPQFGGELRKYQGVPTTGSLPDGLQTQLIHGYLAATSYMDAQFGKVLEALERLDLRKNTIIVFWGDHGWHLGDHGMWCKHTNYEQATRIPLFISGPGLKVGKSNAMIESVDIYPTLCTLAGLPVPRLLDGASYAGVLAGTESAVRDHAIHVYPRNKPGVGTVLGRAIRSERFRMIEWKPIAAGSADAEYELYDYQTDPLETQNLAAAQPDVLKRLQALLASHPVPKVQIEGGVIDAKPKQDRGTMFDRRDTNGDGKLSREEFLLNQPDPDEAPKRFVRFDADGNGSLSRDEYVHSGKAPK
jgi:iduronate 2-sulfatase